MLASRFKILAVTVVLLASAVTGCASGTSSTIHRGAAEPLSVEYYYGTSSTTSPDGKVRFGPAVMTLLRREITPGQERITETVTTPGRTSIMTMHRDSSERFLTVVTDETLEGSVTYSGGEEWRWPKWTYALRMTDGSGLIEGTGFVDDKWLETDRFVVSRTGERRSRTTERLSRITEEEYERRLAELLSQPPTTPATPRR
jgi:hypothetical protein